MRDIVIILALFGPLLYAFRSPWIGLMVWIVVSIMNPHRYTYGFAFGLPYAVSAAGVTLMGLFISKEPKRSILNAPSIILILAFLWMCITTMFSFYPEISGELLNKTGKIYLMIVVASVLIVSEKQIKVLIWVLAMSIGIVSAKGGVFTIMTGGSYRVWGPPSSLVEDNNAFAAASVMTVPLLVFLVTQVKNKWGKRTLNVMSLLLIASALGSQSRGALLAIVAMVGFLILKGKHKFRMLVVVAVLAPATLAFMPDSWTNRMNTIETYQEDDSAMGRINAWWTAFNVANARITGGGFDIANPYVFSLYAPEPTRLHAAHSVYFQILGEHGWPGLFLYLLFWIVGWVSCGWIIKNSRGDPEYNWMSDLARMIQVSLIAFAVGGAFLSIAYFEMPYYEVMALVAMRRILVDRQKRIHVEESRQKMAAMMGA